MIKYRVPLVAVLVDDVEVVLNAFVVLVVVTVALDALLVLEVAGAEVAVPGTHWSNTN